MFWRGYTGTAVKGNPVTKLYTVEVKGKGGENIFAALGFPADEAQALWPDSHRRDREEDALKSSLWPMQSSRKSRSPA